MNLKSYPFIVLVMVCFAFYACQKPNTPTPTQNGFTVYPGTATQVNKSLTTSFSTTGSIVSTPDAYEVRHGKYVFLELTKGARSNQKSPCEEIMDSLGGYGRRTKIEIAFKTPELPSGTFTYQNYWDYFPSRGLDFDSSKFVWAGVNGVPLGGLATGSPYSTLISGEDFRYSDYGCPLSYSELPRILPGSTVTIKKVGDIYTIEYEIIYYIWYHGAENRDVFKVKGSYTGKVSVVS